jgi:hypothetical protein
MTKRNAARAETLSLTVLEALDQAFESQNVAAARCCLETALSAAQELARIGGATEELGMALNETRVALMSRGWC